MSDKNQPKPDPESAKPAPPKAAKAPARPPTKAESQAAAAAMHALHEGNIQQAKLLGKILKMTQEDNDNDAQKE
ncbi:hypothetical protein [Amycolatopsis rubida]|uniref:Uncharacterized protein n=1 Tax=Amycolatopsis rubida TaxID=112413 RepID=A0A1I6B3H0_9PSEU|nr:hypothetical protein [Amycolatopsis rubida]SFQ75490.1 hypothetical protein SAMN05421854_12311 [Amycolatopsis rubida]